MDIIKKTENAVEFYTVAETGESGISDAGLEILIGVSTRTIGKLKQTLQTKAPSETLEPFVGILLTLQTNDGWKINGVDVGNLNINIPDFCIAVIEHYAFEARNYKGRETAVFTYRKFAKMGFNQWVQSITGWKTKNPITSTTQTEQPKVIMPTKEEVDYIKSRPWEKAELEGIPVDFDDVATKSGFKRAFGASRGITKS